jgi:hypothetical protein
VAKRVRVQTVSAAAAVVAVAAGVTEVTVTAHVKVPKVAKALPMALPICSVPAWAPQVPRPQWQASRPWLPCTKNQSIQWPRLRQPPRLWPTCHRLWWLRHPWWCLLQRR